MKLAMNKLYIISGLPGSGKSTLLKEIPAEMVVSTDKIRELISGKKFALDEYGPYKMVSEDSNNIVFEIVHKLIEEKCKQGLTVFLDATNVSDKIRKEYVKLAEKYSMDYEVIILDLPVEQVKEQNKNRIDRVPNYVIDRLDALFERESRFQHRIVKNLKDLSFELIPTHIPEDIFDVIGDIHGLYSELIELLNKLGYSIDSNNRISHPENRKLLFLGDFIDRGEQSLEVLELIYSLVQQGHYAIIGNHEEKLIKSYSRVKNNEDIRGGIAGKITLMNLLKKPVKVQEKLIEFLSSLPHYFVHEKSKTLFVHANIVHANINNLTRSEAIYGFSRFRDIDTDSAYQELKDIGYNKYSLVRGHIPQISKQKDVIALEEQQAFEGYLVGATFNNGKFEPFTRVKSNFNFDKVIETNPFYESLQDLITKKFVTFNTDQTHALNIYKYSKKVFWNNMWNESDLLLKTRGLVLDIAGNIVQHPFDKIFNYGENNTGKNIPNDKRVMYVEKYNGFLGNIGLNPITKDLLVTTTGSFDSQFVDFIKDFIDKDLKSKLLSFFNKNKVTLSFEVLHPEDPHIIKYPDSEMGLVLIGARGLNFTDTSLPEAEVDKIGEELNLRRPKWGYMKFGKLKRVVEDSKLEGYIVRDPDTEEELPILKFKTPYYLTTKFLGRLSTSKINFMYTNPKAFKERVDEEFYEIVDKLVETIDQETMTAMSNEERTTVTRNLIHDLRS